VAESTSAPTMSSRKARGCPSTATSRRSSSARSRTNSGTGSCGSCFLAIGPFCLSKSGRSSPRRRGGLGEEVHVAAGRDRVEVPLLDPPAVGRADELVAVLRPDDEDVAAGKAFLEVVRLEVAARLGGVAVHLHGVVSLQMLRSAQ